MSATQIPFKSTGFFSKTMLDYLEQHPQLQPFYHHFSNVEGFKKQLKEKSASFLPQNREELYKALKHQYKNTALTSETIENLERLKETNTFTITTGHQLNLFTGPLYFLYKILSAINICEELTTHFPEHHFVPVYWMATEDHDFEEINYFNFKGKKVQWNTEQTGAVGRFSTQGLETVLAVFSEHLGTSKNAVYLKNLFEKAYVAHTNLADATRYIANELFGTYGLVIVDGDDKVLKHQFVPYIKEELTKQTSYHQVTKTSEQLETNYKIQVNPREINLFYLTDGVRERILLENGRFIVNNTSIGWTKEELEAHLEEHPECFSPNVILRPLYQEVILPNLCYIGGGGELAYWMQLKSYFEAVNVPFPILLLRNSVQVLSEKQYRKLHKLDISLEELFMKQNELILLKITENSEVCVDFTLQKQFLQEQFDKLREVAKNTDVSFLGAVNAQEKKQLKGLATLEKRLLRAEKRKQSELVNSITNLQNEILPNQALEERQRNFSEYYLEYGAAFIKSLKENLHPLALTFTVLVMEE